MLEHALKYHKAGFNILPMRIEYDDKEKKFLKKVNISWKKYQTEKQTESEIREWWGKWPNAMIGVMTGEINGIYAIDCDSEEAYQKIQDMLPDTFVTPTALSAGGGHHIWVSCSNGNRLPTKTRLIPGLDTRGEGGIIVAPPSQNEISGKNYQWLEGLSIWDVAPQELPYKIISTLLGGYKGGDKLQKDYITSSNTDYNLLHQGSRDQDLFEIGMALADGRYKRDRIPIVLDILAKNCVPPFPEKELQEKIKSIFGRISSKDRNLAEEVHEWTLLQKGNWNTTLIRQELHITTKQDIKNLSVIINRLEEKGIIEKIGEKRGDYRSRGKEAETEMDLSTEDEIQEVNVRLPIDLNDLCILSPGNICVVAGTKSSGKTAMLMNIAWMNQDRFEIVYLNSEMHPTEFKKRMKKFAPLGKWKIKGHKCHNNFHDFITGDKNKIYIVDYLEVNDNFFEIGTPIRKIHERLGDSVCFIGIQMKAGAELGRGGDFSAEKARLYLTMDYNKDEKHTKVTIYDAKEPRPPFDNVRDKFRRVKIIDGHKLSPSDNWRWK
jgi:hypothetical protein